MNLVKLGRVALDGTKVKANASKHKALSYGHLKRIEVQLQDEVKVLTALAEARATLEARARERFAAEQQTFEERQARRQAQRKAGKKPRGKDPQPPSAGPREKGQVNLTDEESRIMPVSGGGFDQCFNAQAGVDTETMLVLGTHVSQAPNDKQ